MVSRLYPGRISHLTLCYVVSYMLFNIQTRHFYVYECETISWICRSMFDWALRESVSRFFNPMSSFLSLMCLSALWLTVFLFLLPFHNCANRRKANFPLIPSSYDAWLWGVQACRHQIQVWSIISLPRKSPRKAEKRNLSKKRWTEKPYSARYIKALSVYLAS